MRPSTSSDVAERRQPRARDVEHLGRRVDGDDGARVGRERRRDAPGAAAEVADDDGGIEQGGQELQVARRAEQLAAQAVPLVGDVGEERLACRARAALQHLLRAGAGRAARRPSSARLSRTISQRRRERSSSWSIVSA